MICVKTVPNKPAPHDRIWSILEYMTVWKPSRIPSDNLQTSRKHVLQDLLHDALKARTGLTKDCMRT